MTRIGTFCIFVMLLVSMLVLGVLPRTQAAPPPSLCSVATLNATYGFQTSGTIPSPVTPIAATGTLTFDGLGGVSAEFTMSTIGIIPPPIFAFGTYTVNPNCTGSMAFTSGSSAFGSFFDLVIAESGKQILLIGADSMTRTNSGDANFAVVSGCTAATLSGTYGFRMTGMTATLEPVAAVGTITFDGLGGIPNAALTININGITETPNPFVSSGSYILNSNCTGTMTFGGIQGIGTFFSLVVLNNSKNVLVISLNTGDTNNGILTRQ